ARQGTHARQVRARGERILHPGQGGLSGAGACRAGADARRRHDADPSGGAFGARNDPRRIPIAMSERAEADSSPWRPLLPWPGAAAAPALSQRARRADALLVTGRRGIGKRSLALHFAKALLCERPNADGGPCGHCASCNYVAAGAHPDLRVIEPIERDEDGNAKPVDAILVDRIRELGEFAQLTSHRQRAKVALIAPAEAMNPAAANALLKTLQVPPPSSYLLLVSDQWGRLPPTIVSRCRVLPAPEPDREAAIAWLAAPD